MGVRQAPPQGEAALFKPLSISTFPLPWLTISSQFNAELNYSSSPHQSSSCPGLKAGKRLVWSCLLPGCWLDSSQTSTAPCTQADRLKSFSASHAMFKCSRDSSYWCSVLSEDKCYCSGIIMKLHQKKQKWSCVLGHFQVKPSSFHGVLLCHNIRKPWNRNHVFFTLGHVSL